MYRKKLAKVFSLSLMTIRKWHWMSAALCFICLLLFAVTGITLHHTRIFLPKPTVTLVEGEFPKELLSDLTLHIEQKKLGLPAPMVKWLAENQGITVVTVEPRNAEVRSIEGKATEKKYTAEKELAETDEAKTVEKNPSERKNRDSENFPTKGPEIKDGKLRIPKNRPGVATVLTIDLATGTFVYEVTDKGWLAYFNDLHKGKNTGMAWVYFMDIFAIACIIFAITGFLLLQRYANTRAKTWPLLIAGLVLPIFFMIFLVH